MFPLLTTLLSLHPGTASARRVGSSLEKALAKRLSNQGTVVQKDWQAVASKDMQNHLKSPQPLPKTRIVERYTSQKQAAKELQQGISPHTHMTTNVHKGHPYSPARIKRRYGIPDSKPIEVKETIRVPAGQPVVQNKVPGGERGVGEITSPKALPKQSIIKISPVPH